MAHAPEELEHNNGVTLASLTRIEQLVALARTLPPVIILSALCAYIVVVANPEERREFTVALKEQDVRNTEEVERLETKCYTVVQENNRLLQEIRRLVEQR